MTLYTVYQAAIDILIINALLVLLLLLLLLLMMMLQTPLRLRLRYKQGRSQGVARVAKATQNSL